MALVGVCIVWNLEPLASGCQSSHKLIPHIICQFLYAQEKTLNEDLFHEGKSSSLPRLHTCENKVPFWDFKEFAITILTYSNRVVVWMVLILPLMSSFYNLLFKPLGTGSRAPTTNGIIVSCIFHGFFTSLARSKYFFIFSFSFIFTVWSTGTAKFTWWQFLFSFVN